MPDMRRLLVPLMALAALVTMPASAGQGDVLSATANARKALARHDGIAAEAFLREALASGARKPDIAAMMGEALLVQDDLAGARKWLEPGEFSRETAGRGFRMLARLELVRDDVDAAGKAYDRALAITPQDPELWVDIGRLRYRVGAQIEAAGASIHALKLDPGNSVALVFRGQMVRDSKGLIAALPFFERALKRAPDDLGVLGEYAATLGEAGRNREMLTVTRKMLAIDDRNAKAFYLQAVLAARAGNYDLAQQLLWRTGTAYDDVPAGLMLSAVLELQAGNSATAASNLQKLVSRQPGNVPAQLLFARALAMNGRWQELADRFEPLAERADAPPYLLTLVGRAWEAAGERTRAAEFLDRAAAQPASTLVPMEVDEEPMVLSTGWQLDPADSMNTILYVRHLIVEGQTHAAQAAADRLLAAHPGAYDPNFLAGDARLMAGNASGALAAYRDAAAIRQPPMLAIRIAMAKQDLGDTAGAEAGLRSYLAQHPRDPDIPAILARRAIARENWAEALPLLDRAIALDLGAQDTRLLADRAQARLDRGDRDGAAGDAVTAYQLQRANDRSAYVMGLVLRAMGGRDRLADKLLERRPQGS